MTPSAQLSPAAKTFPLRLLVYHLHPTSARLRFLKLRGGHICAPSKLPALSELMDHFVEGGSPAVHPKAYVSKLCQQLNIDEDSLAISSEFRCWVDTPSGVVPIFMLRVVREQPFDAPDSCAWIELPDCFALSHQEREIMRRVYQWLLE